jgi:hypothetical protein
MGNIFTDLFTNDNEEEAARQKIAGLQAGRTAADTALDTGLNTATGLYDKAYGNFSDLAAKFGKGQDLYNDATGVNGPEAAARAAEIYRSLPGYSAGRDMGINDLERRAAARGDLGGGNTSADTIKFASDYDSTKYGNFLTSLAPNLSGALSSTAGGANVLGTQAAANLGVGGQMAQYGYNTETGIGNANADATMANEKASSNFWGALLGGANLATKAFGGSFGNLLGGTGGTASTINYGGQSWPAFV